MSAACAGGVKTDLGHRSNSSSWQAQRSAPRQVDQPRNCSTAAGPPAAAAKIQDLEVKDRLAKVFAKRVGE